MKFNIGVEIGAQMIQVGIVDKKGHLLARNKIRSQTGRPLKDIVEDAVKLIHTLLEDECYEPKNIKCIGVASPGNADDENGVIMKAYTLGLYNAPIKEEFAKYFNVPIYVENDAHCAAIAESSAGAAEDLNYSLTINIGLGLSGGIIINNKLFTGFNGTGAVFAHMVIDKDGKQCYCGRKGCFETVCSGKFLIEETRAAALANPGSKIYDACDNDLSAITELTAFEAMKLGDPAAKVIFDTYVDNLATALVNFGNLFMPEVIVLCGSMTLLGENLLKPVREKFNQEIFNREYHLPMLKFSEMGSASILVGAGMLGDLDY